MFIFVSCASQNKLQVHAPTLPKEDKILIKHQNKRVDPYYYVKNKEDPRVIPHLEAENKYTQFKTAHTKKFQEKLVNEFTERIKQDDNTVPYEYGAYRYFSQTQKGKDYPIYLRTHLQTNKTEILLDLNKIQKENNYKYLKLGDYKVSFDHRFLAYSIDTKGNNEYTIYFLDTFTKKLLPDEIKKVDDIVWAADNKTLFYITHDHTKRSHKLFRYILGNFDQHTEVFHEKDNRFYLWLNSSRDQKFIFLGSSSSLTSEQYFLPTANPFETFTLIAKRVTGVRYFVESHENDFYILTNLNAKNFRVLKTSINKFKKDNWQEVIPEIKNSKLSDADLFKDHLVLSYVENGNASLKVFHIPTKKLTNINFGNNVTVDSLYHNRNFETDNILIAHQSMKESPSWYRYNLKSQQMELLKKQEVGGGYSEENYTQKQIMVNARDGEKIPVSIIHRSDLDLSKPNPLYLYGYGSYGSVIYPQFSAYRISMLDRGVIYAIAHVRGGGDKGERWKENGKFLKKKNTFNDFIDVAKYFVEKKYTEPQKLAIEGRSAGGLLIGAVINQEPTLFKVAFAGVPFVDVVTTMLDESIPLTTSEYEEWGNPNNKKYYDYIKSYSPYDNVRPLSYPTMLITSGINDSQVGFWEPTKWAQKLRENSTSGNPILLHMNLDVGHGGSSGRQDAYKERAFEMSFMLDQIGIKN